MLKILVGWAITILKQELLFPVSRSTYFTVMLCNWLSLWPADWILFVLIITLILHILENFLQYTRLGPPCRDSFSSSGSAKDLHFLK